MYVCYVNTFILTYIANTENHRLILAKSIKHPHKCKCFISNKK